MAKLSFNRPALIDLARRAVPMARDALLFLALALAALTLDSPRALWSLWWPLPLALALAALALVMPGGPRLGLRRLAWMALIAAPLVVRGILSLGGPLPVEGLREAIQLAVIFMTCSALWLVASRWPVRAAWIWTGALALGWYGAGLAASGFTAADPTQVAPGLGALLGLAGSLALALQARRIRLDQGAARHSHPIGARLGASALGAAALAAGALLGWGLFESQKTLTLDMALAVEEGLRAQENLWIQSVLVGWGHGPIDRLVKILAQPRQCMLPPWGGPLGILAQGGVAGMLLLAAWCLALMRRPRGALDGPTRLWAALEWTALAGALATAGLFAAGGPRCGLVLFCLGGWSALRLGGTSGARELFSPARNHALACGLALPTGLVFCILIALPVRGEALLKRIHFQDYGRDPALATLARARRLDPFDPAIPMAQAAWWRKKMSASPGWSETYYRRVLDLYERAERLDPYDTLIPLTLAQFQLVCNRDEEALESVTRARQLQPNSLVLLDWIYYFAISRQRNPLAHQMLDLGLEIAPERPEWWTRQFALARHLGQGPLARQTLAVALTANPSDPRLVRLDWESSQATPAGPGVSPEITRPATEVR